MRQAVYMTGAAVAVLLASGGANAQSVLTCAKVNKASIAALFDRWNASLAEGPKAVALNYADDAVLLATVSDKPRTTKRQREDYFEYFLPLKPHGKIDSRTIRIGCNNALDTGTYTFSFGDGTKVKARYTFTYEPASDGKTWLITSHHSSAMPQASGRH